MELFIIYLSLVLFGLCLGSFAGASVWRLRSRQLIQDKKDGEDFDAAEYKKLNKLSKKSLTKDRSQCLSCGYTLEWYDLIPLFSWVFLRGKCRKCRKPIGIMEPIIEIGVALFFVLSYVLWPYSLTSSFEISRFVLWLISGVALAIMFAYDKKWFLLPDFVNYAVVVLGLINSVMVILSASDKLNAVFSIFGAISILSGLYFVLYIVSKGKWIGFGDIKLGLGLALLLTDWKLAFIALFAANLAGCIIVMPALLIGKLKRNSHVPFGPLLIVGMVIAKFIGDYIISLFVL